MRPRLSSIEVSLVASATLIACTAPESRPSEIGRFVDITGAIESNPPFVIGVDGVQPEPVNAFFADLDEDGQDEVIVSPSMIREMDAPDFANATVYTFDRSGRQLTLRGHLTDTPAAPPLAIIDLDGDGHVDVLDEWMLVRWGDAGGRLGAAQPLLMSNAETVIGGRAISFDDVDDDGRLDIVAAGSRCCDTCVDAVPIIATGPRGFSARPDLVTRDRTVGAYSLLSARFGPGSRTFVTFGAGCAGNGGAYGFYRPTHRSPDGYPAFESFDPSPSNSRWVQEVHDDRASISSASPMGGAVADFDADGTLDLAVMINPQHALLRGRSSWPLEDLSVGSGIEETPGDGQRAMIPWSVSALDYDADGYPDLLVTHGNDVGAFADNAIGPQWVVLYRSRGAFRFERSAADLGLGRRGQWKALAVSDLDGDGDPDLAVGGQGEWPRIYLDDLLTPARSFGVRLRGTTSNHLGVGSVVEVRSVGLPVQRVPVVLGGSAWVHSQPIAFATAGVNGMADDVVVHWASGFEQHVGPLPAGHVHTITEPEWLAVRPASRHLPADGQAIATLRIELPATLPFDDHVAPRTLSASVVSGDGTLAPLVRDGDVWTTTITAPSQPGSSVIEVRMDGIPFRIHPRVFWDSGP